MGSALSTSLQFWIARKCKFTSVYEVRQRMAALVWNLFSNKSWTVVFPRIAERVHDESRKTHASQSRNTISEAWKLS